jgi:SAM-dependent methyltransferase
MAKTISQWNERYRAREEQHDLESGPTPLVIETVQHLLPGRSLDLACGAGRNSLWLAERGWRATAIDGAAEAIALLEEKAARLSVTVQTEVADLTSENFSLPMNQWDLVLVCYYLQQNLFPLIKKAVVPGGIVLAIAHVTEAGEEPTETRLLPGELAGYFEGWEILHSYEGNSRDHAHRRTVAEIVARRPDLS